MIKAFRSCRPLRREAGFTLIEMLVVVAIMGFALTMIVTRGPVRSQALEMKAAVSEVAQGLRLARSRAIATNTPVQFAVDVPLRSFRIDRGTPTVLPRSLSIAMTAVSEETAWCPACRHPVQRRRQRDRRPDRTDGRPAAFADRRGLADRARQCPAGPLIAHDTAADESWFWTRHPVSDDAV